jgi:hypothetical protein
MGFDSESRTTNLTLETLKEHDHCGDVTGPAARFAAEVILHHRNGTVREFSPCLRVCGSYGMNSVRISSTAFRKIIYYLSINRTNTPID